MPISRSAVLSPRSSGNGRRSDIRPPDGIDLVIALPDARRARSISSGNKGVVERTHPRTERSRHGISTPRAPLETKGFTHPLSEQAITLIDSENQRTTSSAHDSGHPPGREPVARSLQEVPDRARPDLQEPGGAPTLLSPPDTSLTECPRSTRSPRFWLRLFGTRPRPTS